MLAIKQSGSRGTSGPLIAGGGGKYWKSLPPPSPPSLFYSIPPSPLPHLFISAYTLSKRKTTFRDIHNMKCSWKNMILRGIFHAVSYFLYISCYIAEIWIAFLTVYSHLTIHIKYSHVEWVKEKEKQIKHQSKQFVKTFECLQIIIYIL